MFNNAVFSAETIEGMTDMHPTTQRLYAAARSMRDVTGQSAVARLLDVSPQAMKNWEARGVSEGGALKAQRVIGCDANWVLTGEPQMAFKPVQADKSALTTHAIHDERALYKAQKQHWPFTTFTPDEYFTLLDSEYRQTIEDQLLGAITRIKQAAATQLTKHG